MVTPLRTQNPSVRRRSLGARLAARGSCLGQLGQVGLPPVGDRPPPEHLVELAPPSAPLRQGHGDRPVDGLGDPVDVVRVDDHGALELAGGAGERGQDQHPRVVGVLSGDVLLGHQVHAVAQRGHQPDPCRPVEAGQRALGVGAVDVAQRHPVGLAEPSVDCTRLTFEVGADLAVLRDLTAGRRRDLEEDRLPPVLGVAVEEAAEGGEPVVQPLGVVEPVDTDDQPSTEQRVTESAHRDLLGRPHGLLGDEVAVDRDGDALHEGARAGRHRDVVVVRQAAAGEVDQVVDAGLTVALGLEAHEVVVGQRLHECPVPRQRDDEVGRGKRGVQEETDPRAHPFLAQQRGERHQVVVLDPDEVVVADHRGEHACERAVDPLVAPVGVAAVVDEVQPVVQQRPQRTVGEAVVVGVVLSAGEVDGDVLDPALGHLRRRAGGVDHLAGPAEPDAAVLGEGGLHRRGKPTRACLARHVPPGSRRR